MIYYLQCSLDQYKQSVPVTIGDDEELRSFIEFTESGLNLLRHIPGIKLGHQVRILGEDGLIVWQVVVNKEGLEQVKG